MYDESEEAPAAPPEESQEQAPEEKDPSGGKTALINSEICPGMKVGDTMLVDIVGVHDGEYEVKYNTKPESESPESNPSPEGGPGGAEPGMGNYE